MLQGRKRAERPRRQTSKLPNKGPVEYEVAATAAAVATRQQQDSMHAHGCLLLQRKRSKEYQANACLCELWQATHIHSLSGIFEGALDALRQDLSCCRIRWWKTSEVSNAIHGPSPFAQ